MTIFGSNFLGVAYTPKDPLVGICAPNAWKDGHGARPPGGIFKKALMHYLPKKEKYDLLLISVVPNIKKNMIRNESAIHVVVVSKQ